MRAASSLNIYPASPDSAAADSFGIDWRQIIESRHRRATIAEWFKQHGRHTIYGGYRAIDLKSLVMAGDKESAEMED